MQRAVAAVYTYPYAYYYSAEYMYMCTYTVAILFYTYMVLCGVWNGTVGSFRFERAYPRETSVCACVFWKNGMD